ncbi:MAG: uncharacterized protein KVP18_004753, partial [Porospora cf. gigantea A]|uniref:uncharacterized protein n=1 Tax=Porospora cf. gigantea A TaxID=2853593 RepID=UPI00355AABC2
MTNEPFRSSDLIDIQNPRHVESRELANFQFIKNDDLGKLSIFEESPSLPQRPPPPLANDESRPRINETRLIRKIHAAERTLQKEHTALFPRPEERPRGPMSQLYTTPAHASSVTSTWVDRSQEQYREMTDQEIRKDLYRSIKGSGKKGFVRLVTDLGPLNLELYCDQTPQTCHNFLLHCKSGYYRDTIFHRCIPNFMVQGGDPEGTGRGGVPAFSGVETFGDEFRAKLRHTGRGVLSMANSGSNTNKSQFFLTFASAEHLNDKHTIFGRLVGGKETLAAMEALRTNQEGRPKAPPRIVEVIVYSDPFDASGDEGAKKPAEVDRLHRDLRALCDGLHALVDPLLVADRVICGVYCGMSTVQLSELAAQTCAYMAATHPDFSKLAARIAISNLHRNTADDYLETCKVLFEYTDEQGRCASLISEDVYEFIVANADRINKEIDYRLDFEYDYFGFKTLERSYLLKVRNSIVERPQHMLMRVSCGIHCGRIEKAMETYHLMSQKFFTHATPTLFNAGTRRPQMSSCFLLTMKEDSISGIFDTLKQCALISNTAGGIGLCVSHIRATGSFIRGSNGRSNGIVPMLRVFNTASRYVDYNGRMSRFACYLEPWHSDVFDFVELRKNHGKEEHRARDLFLALWIPDLFMKRV